MVKGPEEPLPPLPPLPPVPPPPPVVVDLFKLQADIRSATPAARTRILFWTGIMLVPFFFVFFGILVSKRGSAGSLLLGRRTSTMVLVVGLLSLASPQAF